MYGDTYLKCAMVVIFIIALIFAAIIDYYCNRRKEKIRKEEIQKMIATAVVAELISNDSH